MVKWQISMTYIIEYIVRILDGLIGQKMESLLEARAIQNDWKPLRLDWFQKDRQRRAVQIDHLLRRQWFPIEHMCRI